MFKECPVMGRRQRTVDTGFPALHRNIALTSAAFRILLQRTVNVYSVTEVMILLRNLSYLFSSTVRCSTSH